jgi:hypothetical protein
MAIDVTPLPPADAVRAFLARGNRLDPSFAWQDVWQDDHASMFTVAKSAGFDVLGDIYQAVQKSLDEGKTFRDFTGELTPLLQKKGWWGRQRVRDPLTGETVSAQLGSTRRLQTIFDVSMRVSYAAGHWASFERNKKLRPFLRYVHVEEQPHPRWQHHLWHNTVLPVDDPWWNTHACPNGWGCKCTLQSLSQRDIDRLIRQGEKLKFEAPVINTVPWTNKRTGEVTHVPEGIDPGWAYNPGKASQAAAINTAFATKVPAAPYDLARAAVDDTVRSDAFRKFLADPEGTMPVMAIPPSIGSALRTDASVALLSADTMVKQLANHPELTTTDYLALPGLATDPTLAVKDGDLTVVLLRLADGRWMHAALKTTRTRKAAFVTSFRFTSLADISRLLGRRGIRVLIDRR